MGELYTLISNYTMIFDTSEWIAVIVIYVCCAIGGTFAICQACCVSSIDIHKEGEKNEAKYNAAEAPKGEEEKGLLDDDKEKNAEDGEKPAEDAEKKGGEENAEKKEEGDAEKKEGGDAEKKDGEEGE